jgi:hypothetical protein
MSIDRLHEEVYIINNFLLPEELKDIYKMIDEASENDWFNENNKIKYHLSDFWFGKSLMPDFDKTNIFETINQKIYSLFDSYFDNSNKLHLKRYLNGDFINYHSDRSDYSIGNSGQNIAYGVCLYYNDDYLGGELHYPDLDIISKPIANSLYIHSGKTIHGSLPVIGNIPRYFSTSFIYETSSIPAILNKELFK